MPASHKKTSARNWQEALKQKVMALYQRLPANQKKVTDYFLQHPNEAAFHTTDSMAAALQVSKATIVRFAQSLGYDGFTALHEEVVDAVQSHLEPAERFIKAQRTQRSRAATKKIIAHGMELSRNFHWFYFRESSLPCARKFLLIRVQKLC